MNRTKYKGFTVPGHNNWIKARKTRLRLTALVEGVRGQLKRESNPMCRNCQHHFTDNHIWCMGDIICVQCDCIFRPLRTMHIHVGGTNEHQKESAIQSC